MAIAAASADGKDVFGKNGLFDELKKALAERMRMAPMLKSAQASSPWSPKPLRSGITYCLDRTPAMQLAA